MTETIQPAERIRKIDLDKLPKERQDAMADQVGKKIGQIISSAEAELKRLLDIYDLKIDIVWNLSNKSIDLKNDKMIPIGLTDEKPKAVTGEVTKEKTKKVTKKKPVKKAKKPSKKKVKKPEAKS